MLKKYSKIIIIVLFVFLLIGACLPVLAGGIVPNGVKKATGNYNLNDFIQLAVNVSQWILGIVGSITLLFFVYGGFTFIFSGGRSETVNKGKTILINSIIGLIIVFTSYMIINFSISALGVEPATNGSWFQTNWFEGKEKK